MRSAGREGRWTHAPLPGNRLAAGEDELAATCVSAAVPGEQMSRWMTEMESQTRLFGLGRHPPRANLPPLLLAGQHCRRLSEHCNGHVDVLVRVDRADVVLHVRLVHPAREQQFVKPQHGWLVDRDGLRRRVPLPLWLWWHSKQHVEASRVADDRGDQARCTQSSHRPSV